MTETENAIKSDEKFLLEEAQTFTRARSITCCEVPPLTQLFTLEDLCKRVPNQFDQYSTSNGYYFHARHSFLEFCQKEKVIENFYFVADSKMCLNYMKSNLLNENNLNSAIRWFLHLVHVYVFSSSLYEVNLDSATRNEFLIFEVELQNKILSHSNKHSIINRIENSNVVKNSHRTITQLLRDGVWKRFDSSFKADQNDHK